MQTVNASPYPRQRLLKEAQLRCARRSPFAKRKAPKRHAFSSPFSLLLHLLLFFFLHKPRTSCRGRVESPNLGPFFFFFNWVKTQCFELQLILKKKGPKHVVLAHSLFKIFVAQNATFWPNKINKKKKGPT